LTVLASLVLVLAYPVLVNITGLNSNKCQVVSYGSTIDTSTVYTIMDQNQQVVPLARLDKIKDTGVYFDAKLDFRIICRKNK